MNITERDMVSIVKRDAPCEDLRMLKMLEGSSYEEMDL